MRRCTGCGRCISACPPRLFTLEQTGYRKVALLHHPERCSSCGACTENCPVGALAFPAKTPQGSVPDDK